MERSKMVKLLVGLFVVLVILTISGVLYLNPSVRTTVNIATQGEEVYRFKREDGSLYEFNLEIDDLDFLIVSGVVKNGIEKNDNSDLLTIAVPKAGTDYTVNILLDNSQRNFGVSFLENGVYGSARQWNTISRQEVEPFIIKGRQIVVYVKLTPEETLKYRESIPDTFTVGPTGGTAFMVGKF